MKKFNEIACRMVDVIDNAFNSKVTAYGFSIITVYLMLRIVYACIMGE